MKKIKRKTINTESSEDVTHTNILKKEKGITLIALVVTIVVLLILAGVSINLVIGNNGIITKSKEARIVTRADNAEDEVELWKGNNYIAKNSNGSSESKNDMLQRLIDKKLVYEDEIDRNNEIITIKREDGTIVKKINYGGVVIHISKIPETEEAGTVILKVTSVEGVATIRLEDIPALDETTKKDLIRNTQILYCNQYEGTNFSKFEEVVQYYYEQGLIAENSEEAFWNDIDMNMDEWLRWNAEYDEDLNIYYLCQVINPGNELSDTYLATENGTYTFTIYNSLTRKTYTKSVEVNNIGKNLQHYTVSQADWRVKLMDSDTDTPTTFSQAYVIYGGETIDITSLIRDDEENIYIYDGDVSRYLESIGKSSFSELGGKKIPIILLKDGIQYAGFVTLPMPE